MILSLFDLTITFILVMIALICIFKYKETEEEKEIKKYLMKIEKEEAKKEEEDLEKKRFRLEVLVTDKLNAKPQEVIVKNVEGSNEEYKVYYKGDIYTAIIKKEKIIKFVKSFKRWWEK